MNRFLAHFIGLTLIFCLGAAQAMAMGGNALHAIDNFAEAKRLLETRVYADHRITIYCGAKFDAQKRIEVPPGFRAASHDARTRQMEWEHAVPAENFGRAFREWREGAPQCVQNGKPYHGRKCAEKTNPEYRRMALDLYNLFPAIGSVNASRGNKQYAELESGYEIMGSCPAKVARNAFEPPDEAKGEVARASLYMEDRYRTFRLSKKQRNLFTAWDRLHPVTSWDCARAKRIERIQGNENKFVKEPCLKLGLWP